MSGVSNDGPDGFSHPDLNIDFDYPEKPDKNANPLEVRAYLDKCEDVRTSMNMIMQYKADTKNAENVLVMQLADGDRQTTRAVADIVNKGSSALLADSAKNASHANSKVDQAVG